jgi:succinate-semialdehyde dehydrogenase/glutarate-semialdehyde dehydrogenase
LLLATSEWLDPALWERALKQAQEGGGHFPPIEL